MVWHQNVRDQFGGPLLIQLFEFNEESSTTDLFAKDRKSVDAVASYIVKGSGKVEI